MRPRVRRILLVPPCRPPFDGAPLASGLVLFGGGFAEVGGQRPARAGLRGEPMAAAMLLVGFGLGG